MLLSFRDGPNCILPAEIMCKSFISLKIAQPSLRAGTVLPFQTLSAVMELPVLAAAIAEDDALLLAILRCRISLNSEGDPRETQRGDSNVRYATGSAANFPTRVHDRDGASTDRGSAAVPQHEATAPSSPGWAPGLGLSDSLLAENADADSVFDRLPLPALWRACADSLSSLVASPTGSRVESHAVVHSGAGADRGKGCEWTVLALINRAAEILLLLDRHRAGLESDQGKGRPAEADGEAGILQSGGIQHNLATSAEQAACATRSSYSVRQLQCLASVACRVVLRLIDDTAQNTDATERRHGEPRLPDWRLVCGALLLLSNLLYYTARHTRRAQTRAGAEADTSPAWSMQPGCLFENQFDFGTGPGGGTSEPSPGSKEASSLNLQLFGPTSRPCCLNSADGPAAIRATSLATSTAQTGCGELLRKAFAPLLPDFVSQAQRKSSDIASSP